VAVTVGVSISFGMLDIVNIAHPAFIILGSYLVYIVNSTFGIDPVLVGLLMLPVFYALGAAVYEIYYLSFEKRGQEALRGLAFFFGILFITEVGLILVFGVDYRYAEAAYIGPALRFAFVDLPYRMLIPCVISLLLLAALQLYFSRTFIGRAIKAVSQDQQRSEEHTSELQSPYDLVCRLLLEKKKKKKITKYLLDISDISNYAGSSQVQQLDINNSVYLLYQQLYKYNGEDSKLLHLSLTLLNT